MQKKQNGEVWKDMLLFRRYKHFSFTETEIIRQEVTKDEATYQGGFFKKVIAILKILKFNLLQIIFKFFLQ